MQTDDGGFEPILPREDLEAIHARILALELVVKGNAGGAVGAVTQQEENAASRTSLNLRLAAALGLQVAGPRLQCRLADLVGLRAAAPAVAPASAPACSSPSGTNPLHTCKVATLASAGGAPAAF